MTALLAGTPLDRGDDDGSRLGPPPVLTAKLRPPAGPAIWRGRLDPIVHAVGIAGVAVVTAPAGAGKTTFLGQLAERLGGPVAWYRADHRDGGEATFVAYLQRALATALDLHPVPSWTTVDDVAMALERRRIDRRTGTPRVHLVIDDVHTLEGTAAAAALHRLLAVRPTALGMLLGSGTLDAVDLERLRAVDGAVVVDAEHLRFRPWEVEAWISTIAGEHLTPEQAATLTSATGGWATGVQLFRTATSGTSSTERARLLSTVESAGRPAYAYLARTVLDGLDAELRQFLLVTSVLELLTPARCDRFVDGSGSAALLDLLHRRGVFTFTNNGGTTYRYHDVLRAALEIELVSTLGPARVRELHGHAGALLEADGETTAAIVAYGRAGAWSAVQRLLCSPGRPHGAHRWVDALPRTVVAQDACLQAERALGLALDGDLTGAHDTFVRANRIAFHHQRRAPWQAQEHALAPWAERAAPAHDEGPLRRGVRSAPHAAALALLRRGDSHARLAAALCLVVAGDTTEAAAHADRVRKDPTADALTQLAAVGLWTLTDVLATPSPGGAHRLLGLADQAASLGVGLAGRVLRQLELPASSPSGDGASPSWPDALTALAVGIIGALQDREEAPTMLRAAADELRRLDAGAAAAWATALADGCTGRAGPISTASAHPSSAPPVPGGPPGTRVRIRCLGPFEVLVDGAPVVLHTVKPRALEFLHLLAAAAPGGVSRDALVEALWPGAPLERGAHRLHVTVSALRRGLSAVAPGLGERLVRHRDRIYALDMQSGVEVDAATARAAVDDLHRLERVGAVPPSAYAEVVAMFRGEPLAERATTEWAVAWRRELTRLCTDAAYRAAVLHAGNADHGAAADVCARALLVDPYDDRLWDLRQRSLTAGGNVLAAAAVRRHHQELLGFADLV